jgi:hypothetical protein
MTLFITFVATLIGMVANNIAGEVTANEAVIDQILQDMPRDLGIMLVNFIEGLHGLMPAIGGMLT